MCSSVSPRPPLNPCPLLSMSVWNMRAMHGETKRNITTISLSSSLTLPNVPFSLPVQNMGGIWRDKRKHASPTVYLSSSVSLSMSPSLSVCPEHESQGETKGIINHHFSPLSLYLVCPFLPVHKMRATERQGEALVLFLHLLPGAAVWCNVCMTTCTIMRFLDLLNVCRAIGRQR